MARCRNEFPRSCDSPLLAELVLLADNRADSIAASGSQFKLKSRANLNFKILAGIMFHSQSGQLAITGKLWEDAAMGSDQRGGHSL